MPIGTCKGDMASIHLERIELLMGEKIVLPYQKGFEDKNP